MVLCMWYHLSSLTILFFSLIILSKPAVSFSTIAISISSLQVFLSLLSSEYPNKDFCKKDKLSGFSYPSAPIHDRNAHIYILSSLSQLSLPWSHDYYRRIKYISLSYILRYSMQADSFKYILIQYITIRVSDWMQEDLNGFSKARKDMPFL